MKITTYETVDVEVETNIDIEDIANCIIDSDLGKTKFALTGAINNFHRFMEAIPDEIIDQLTEKQRVLIGEYLSSQAQRFSDTKEGDA